MSIPAGLLVERFGEKTAMIAAFLVGTAGSLSFALHPGYRVAVFSLFVMGSGMATLQTAINPLLRVSGAKRISLSIPHSPSSSSEAPPFSVRICIRIWS